MTMVVFLSLLNKQALTKVSSISSTTQLGLKVVILIAVKSLCMWAVICPSYIHFQEWYLHPARYPYLIPESLYFNVMELFYFDL